MELASREGRMRRGKGDVIFTNTHSHRPPTRVDPGHRLDSLGLNLPFQTSCKMRSVLSLVTCLFRSFGILALLKIPKIDYLEERGIRAQYHSNQFDSGTLSSNLQRVCNVYYTQRLAVGHISSRTY